MYRIKKFFSDLKLRNKFIIAYALLLILPLLLTGILFYHWFAGMAVEQTSKIASQTVKQAELNIGFIRQEIENFGGMEFGNMDLQESLKERESTIYEQSEEYKTIINTITQMEGNPRIHRVRFYVPDYKTYAHEKNNIFALSTIEEDPYFKIMMDKGDKMGWTDCYTYMDSDGRKEEIVSYMVILIDFGNLDQVVGCLCIDVLEKEFYDVLKEIKIADNGFAFMVNGDEGIISESCPDSADVDGILDGLFGYLHGKENETSVFNNFNWKGRKYSFINTPIRDCDWKIVYIMPTSEVMKNIEASIRFTIIIIVVCILLAFIIAVMVSKKITQGIHNLIDRMEKVEEKGVEAIDEGIIEYSKDEIGQLQRHFHQMIEKIQHLVMENYDVQLQRREAQLKALQAQINPHFLYNVLDSINWMAIRVKAMNISDMVTDLGRFYRIGLSGGREVISIQEELEHVKTYLKIQKARFEDSLDVTFDVSEEILNYPTVKLTLQPIIENAIVHGILAKPSQKGIIKICGKKDGEQIKIQIIDDGLGVNFEKVHYILSDPNSQFSKGFGIKNVDQRIKLYFGQQYGMEIKRESDQWTVVVITLPARMDAHKNK